VDRPRLKAHFRVVVGPGEVFLTAEGGHYLVTGPGAAAVLPYLDGRHTVADIAVSLSGAVAPADVLRAVRKYGSPRPRSRTGMPSASATPASLPRCAQRP
jgi:ribosomal protein S12 methylthiotransferase accessory factor